MAAPTVVRRRRRRIDGPSGIGSVWQPGRARCADYRGPVATATRPRRPLPRRVYWVRRLLVLGVAGAAVAWALWVLSAARGARGGPTRGRPDRLATPAVGLALVGLLLAFAVTRNTGWGAVLAP